MLTMEEWREAAKKAAECANDQCETIIFMDGTVTTVTGSWQVNKPVLLVLGPGQYTVENVWTQMKERIEYMREMEKIKRKFWNQFK